MVRTTGKLLLTITLLLMSSLACFAADPAVPAVKATGQKEVKAGADKAKSGAAKAGAATVEDAKATTKASAAKLAQVDINTATDAELKSVPGIGDTYAAKIIAGRPYAKKDQLKTRKILPSPVYEQVKDRLIAKQLPKK